MTAVTVWTAAERLAAKQAAYVLKRRQQRGAQTIPLRFYRVTYADGRQVEERCIGLAQVAAEHPEAVLVEWIGSTEGAFW